MQQQRILKSRGTSAMSPAEIDVARLIQADIPLTERPFRRLAKTAGLSEMRLLSLVRGLKARGVIRKFVAIVRHQRVGYTHNVMVLWAVPPELAGKGGKALSRFKEVTHCYERTPPYAGRYNLFTMIHFRTQDSEVRLREMAAASGIDDFRVLRSLEEFKKNSMEYF